MHQFIEFALLGLGAGAVYSTAAIGLVQVYRGSGVLNLAHGAIAFVSAVIYLMARTRWGWAFLPAALGGILAAGVVGAGIEVLVMRRLRSASVLVRVVATLGVFAIVQSGIPIIFGKDFSQTSVTSFYPAGKVRLASDISVPYDRLIIVAITICMAIVLKVVSERTRFGLATTASAESATVSASLGVNPDAVGLGNWVLGSVLAGIAGVMLLPIIGVATAATFLLLVVPALAAAMIGRFQSFAITVAAGVAIGVGQSLMTRYQTTIFPHSVATGWPDALPFLVIIGVLALGGTPFPSRSELPSRLPKLGRAVARPSVVVVLCGLAIVGCTLVSGRVAVALAASAALGIVGLSLVIITGLGGQVSLGQMAIAGTAAVVAARASGGLGLDFPVAAALGIVGGSLIGLLFAGPALRTRGPTLAVATLGIGLAVEEVVLHNTWFTGGGFTGTAVHSPTLGPLSIDGVNHPQRYAAVAVVLAIVAAYGVANLRASAVGRRLIAVRSSERAAAAHGISVARTKTAAFVLSAAYASLGGVLLAFQVNSVTFLQYGLADSFNLLVFTLIGGIGYVTGPLIGALGSPSGLMSLFNQHATVLEWLIVASGFLLILTLIFNPDGVAASWPDIAVLHRRSRPHPVAGSPSRGEAVGQNLEISGLTVVYGSVRAVDNLSLVVEPGEIVGLIGPNGAGKTTVIDAVTGFVGLTEGSLRLGGADITRKSVDARVRAGLARSFQTVEPFNDLNVAENIAVGFERVRWFDWLRTLARPTSAALDQELRAEASSLELDLDRFPDSLSQGRRRALGVLRALATRPAVLLLDEPAAGLDKDETKHLGTVLRRVAKERGIGLLLVEHDMTLVSAVCDKVVLIDFGKTLFAGSMADAFDSPIVRAAYLGEAVSAELEEGVVVTGDVRQ